MKLYETINTAPIIYQQLQQRLPAIKISYYTSEKTITIGGLSYKGSWKLLEVLLGITESQIRKQIQSSLKDLSDKAGEDEEMVWEDAYSDKLYDVGVKAVQNFEKDYLPDGWIISEVFWSTDDDPMSPIFNITIKKDFDRRSRSTQQEWYHITLLSNLKSIKQTGLKPTSMSPSEKRFGFGTYKNRTFLLHPSVLKNKKQIQELAQNLQSGRGDSIMGWQQPHAFKQIAILKVTLTSTQIKRIDTTANHVKGIYVQDHIPPENIKVVYSGKIDDYN